ncbi:MAG TPA: hypothetical protein PKV76_00060 [Chitinophagales bacterium]|jgi:hypothetical protein|nr:hypothetical protein [Chitinophagales bacterium]
MKATSTNNNFLLATGLVLAAVIFRILSNQFNFFNLTPVIAVALFAGAKFKDNKAAILIPIVTMFISDAILAYLNNHELFHNTILFTYGSVVAIIFLGKLLNNSKLNIVKTVGLSLVSSLLFFLISNFGVWLFSNMYSLTTSGLIQCYVMAIPFNKFSWLGDLFFVVVLFGIYEVVSTKITAASGNLVWQKSDTID